MNIEDLEIGKSYTCGDDCIYYIIYIDPHHKWFISLNYSLNHNILVPTIYNNEFLNESYNENLYELDEWDIEDMINYDNVEYIDRYTLKFT